MPDITQYWKEHALDNIMPPRNGAEFPDGEIALQTLRTAVGPGDVLEFGCGRGRLAPLFEADNYLGVDISESALEVAKGANPRHWFQLIEPFETLPYAPTVFAYTVLHHIPDDLLLDACDQLMNNTDRIVVAEVMDPAFRHERTPPCLNRAAGEYVDIFTSKGWQLKEHHVVDYAAYQDRKMTVLEFE